MIVPMSMLMTSSASFDKLFVVVQTTFSHKEAPSLMSVPVSAMAVTATPILAAIATARAASVASTATFSDQIVILWFPLYNESTPCQKSQQHQPRPRHVD